MRCGAGFCDDSTACFPCRRVHRNPRATCGVCSAVQRVDPTIPSVACSGCQYDLPLAFTLRFYPVAAGGVLAYNGFRRGEPLVLPDVAVNVSIIGCSFQAVSLFEFMPPSMIEIHGHDGTLVTITDTTFSGAYTFVCPALERFQFFSGLRFCLGQI